MAQSSLEHRISQPALAPPAPARAEIEEAFAPALIVEQLEGGSHTVPVPAVPTPMAGAIYILPLQLRRDNIDRSIAEPTQV